MRWSEAVTLEFVKIYLKHECLWNPAHPDYKLKYLRDKAYKAIASEFRQSTTKDLTIPEVRIKIKNLRTTYVQQVQKILQKSSPDSIYEPSLIWFKEMDQCLKHITSSSRLLNLTSASHDAEVDSSCQVWYDQEIANDNSTDLNPDPLKGELLVENPYEEITQPETKFRKKKRKSHKYSDSQAYKKIKKKKLKSAKVNSDDSTDSSTESNNREDEFDIYGKYIASQLRAMNLEKALRLQLEIQSLVSESRISEISSD